MRQGLNRFRSCWKKPNTVRLVSFSLTATMPLAAGLSLQTRSRRESVANEMSTLEDRASQLALVLSARSIAKQLPSFGWGRTTTPKLELVLLKKISTVIRRESCSFSIRS
jgi:hypothetical protein